MILALWAAAAAHTLIFYIISYMIARPRHTTIAGSFFAALTVAGTALPILACGESGCTSGTLSISRTVSPLPWCVAFGVLLAMAGIAGVCALRGFGCPLIGAAALASLVWIGAAGGRWHTSLRFRPCVYAPPSLQSDGSRTSELTWSPAPRALPSLHPTNRA